MWRPPKDNTHARVYTLITWAPKMHGSWQYKYSQVNLGDVRGILCPSNALSVLFGPHNASKFEKYVIEADWEFSRCVVSYFWPRCPNMEVTWCDHTPKIAECSQKCPNMPDCYLTHRNLMWEIPEIFNATFAMQKAIGRGIMINILILELAACDHFYLWTCIWMPNCCIWWSPPFSTSLNSLWRVQPIVWQVL